MSFLLASAFTKLNSSACTYEVLSKYAWSDGRVKYRLETASVLSDDDEAPLRTSAQLIGNAV